jgi:hypothetical protein
LIKLTSGFVPRSLIANKSFDKRCEKLNSDVFSDVLQQLEQRPDRLSDIRLWLFVAVNTARALIDSTDKQALENAVFTDCKSVSEIQYGFDMIQGRYGRKFRSSTDARYNYLCSLVAFFSDRELTQEELVLAQQYNKVDKYLIYEL